MAEQKQDDQLEHTYSSYCEDTGCSPEDLPEAMNDREKWRERIFILVARYDEEEDTFRRVQILKRPVGVQTSLLQGDSSAGYLQRLQWLKR